MSDYTLTWIARLVSWSLIGGVFVFKFNYPIREVMIAAGAAVIILLVIDLFQYAYRTYGDRKQ